MTPGAIRHAFSLIELIISMAILSVGLVGAMRVFPVGLRASRRAELSSRAAIAAQRIVESLKLEPWERIAEGETTVEEDGFEIATRISRPTLDHLADAEAVKAAHVSVRWTQDGRPRELGMVTYLWKGSSSP